MAISSSHYISKIIGLMLLQTSILIFYVAFGKITGGIVPIDIGSKVAVYSSPLPHVLMLTAIVVGFATSALALALARQIYRHFGTLNCHPRESWGPEINQLDSHLRGNDTMENKL